MARRHKRLWTAEEKRSICARTRAPGVLVAQVGQRYAFNANLIHKWLRDPQFAPEGPEDASTGSDASDGQGTGDAVECPPDASDGFLAVEMVGEEAVDDAVVECHATGRGVAHRSADSSFAEAPGLIEVELAGGHRLRITGAYDADALSRLLRALTA